jgi:hypothetical protein
MTDITPQGSQFALIEGIDEVIQKATIRLETFRGEWPFDNQVGLNWIEWATSKDIPDPVIAGQIKNELLEVEGVTDVSVAIENPQTFVATIQVDPSIEEGNIKGVELEASPGDPITRVRNR